MYKVTQSGREVNDLKKKKGKLNKIKYRYITEHILILKVRYLKSSRNVIVI